MRKIAFIAVRLFVILLLGSVRASSAPSPRPVDMADIIVAGRSFGPLRLGTHLTEVINRLGVPKLDGLGVDARLFGVPGSRSFSYPQLAVSFETTCGLVTSVATEWYLIDPPEGLQRYRTDKGIRIGSTVEQVIAAYGREFSLPELGTVGLFTYPKIGISFWFRDGWYAQSTIRSISIDDQNKVRDLYRNGGPKGFVWCVDNARRAGIAP